MLKIVNPELFSYNVIKYQDEKTHNQYEKMRILTGVNILQNLSDDKKRSNQKHDEKSKVEVDKLVPMNREILRLSSLASKQTEIDKNISISDMEFNSPMSLNVVMRTTPQVEVRCHDSGDDRVAMLVIAYPFNGMMKPIPENKEYRIYKGMLVKSVTPFYYHNNRYKKVLYLVIEINKNLFNIDHKYHTDFIEIPFESYAVFTDKESGKQKTAHDSMKLTITSPKCDYVCDFSHEVLNEAIEMNIEPGEQLWTTFTFDKKSNKSNKPHKKHTSGQKPYTIEGDVKVTKNKHGIRKEIPLNKNKRVYHQATSTGGYTDYRMDLKSENTKERDLDEMIKNSGMYDNERNKRYDGKRKRKH